MCVTRLVILIQAVGPLRSFEIDIYHHYNNNSFTSLGGDVDPTTAAPAAAEVL
jgi:hypothetical protein